MNHPIRELDTLSQLNKKQLEKFVRNTLRRYGLPQNSQSWWDYEKAKRIIFGNKWIEDQEKYHVILNAITDYLQV